MADTSPQLKPRHKHNPVPTAHALRFATIATQKLRRGEPLAPKGLTCEAFGPYLPLIRDWQNTLQEAIANQETNKGILQAMEAYWLVVRSTPTYRDLVAAVDQADVEDAAAVLAPAEASSQTPYSDQFNAEALVSASAGGLRYCHPWATWLCWTGTHWERDQTGHVMRQAKQTIKAMGKSLERLNDAEVKARLSHMKASLSASRLKAMIELAGSEPGIPVLPDAIDQDPWLLNCLNGVVDLRTGDLHPHDPQQLMTKVCPVSYDPEATCPRWERFLREIFQDNTETIAFIRRAIGYSLTGDVSERALFICWGEGRNGKSTFLEVIADLLGEYAYRAPTELFMAKRDSGIPNDVAQLPGRRFVHASETDEGRRLSEAFIKDVTGRDTLSARFMRGEFFTFKPVAKLWLRTNHRPEIRGTDQAIWDRIRLIPFVRRFRDGEDDKQLPLTLRSEIPGILAWAATGCLLWQTNGLGLSKAVDEANQAYRTEMDTIGGFLADCCVTHQAASVTSKALMTAYTEWCTQNGEKALTSKALAGRLRERGYEPTQGTHGVRMWRGLGLHAIDREP